jgi:septum formation protein
MEAKHIAIRHPHRASKKDDDFQPSSPTDHMLSPISRRLLRKNSKAKPDVSFEHWVPGEHVHVILGSSSKARKEILEQSEWEFTTISPNIDERAINCSDPFRLPVLIAKAKANAVIDSLEDKSVDTVVITCDQVVLFNGQVLGKPGNKREAYEMLKSYSGKSLQTISAVVATHIPSMRQCSETDIATVFWKLFTDDDVEDMVDNEDVLYSAGGFLVEDSTFSRAIERIDGDFNSVRGLPMKATARVVRTVLNTGI